MSIYRYEIKYKKWIRQSVGMLTVSKMSPLEGPSPETSFRAFKNGLKVWTCLMTAKSEHAGHDSC